MEEENRPVEVEQPTPVYAPTPQAPKNNNLLIIIIGLILLVAIGGGAFYFGQKLADNDNEEKETSKKKDKKKDKDEEEEEEEEEDDNGKGGEKEEIKPSGTKTISCSGDFEGMQGATMNVEFTYSNSKKTITSGSMDMKMNMKAMLKEMGGAQMTDAELDAALAELQKADASEICDSMKDDSRYKNCTAKINGSVINAHVDFDVDELMGELSDKEKEFEPSELADYFEDDMGITCSVR